MTRSPFIAALLLAAPLAGTATAQVINVEIDYMVASDHSHMPSPAEVNALVQMFACKGISLNVVVDDAIPHSTFMQCDIPGFQDFWTCESVNFTTYKELKDQFFDAPGGGIGWHYCVFGHQYNNGDGVNSSGLAEISGNDFVVTLGSFTAQVGTPFAKAATLGHELGHNLGLRHYGMSTALSFGPYAPNYASIMSYQYQLSGVASQMECLGLVDQDHRLKDLDYSSGRMPTIAEPALSEPLGLGIHAVDWDCDGLLDGGTVQQDLDNERPWCSGGGVPIGSLADHNDWSFINDSASDGAVVDGTAELDTIACITSDEARALRDGQGAGLIDPSGCSGSSPTLVTEPCQGGEMIWVDPGAGVVQLGTGNLPFQNLTTAAAVASAGSVLYLQPGTHSNGGTSIVLTQALVLAGPGSAVVDP